MKVWNIDRIERDGNRRTTIVPVTQSVVTRVALELETLAVGEALHIRPAEIDPSKLKEQG